MPEVTQAGELDLVRAWALRQPPGDVVLSLPDGRRLWLSVPLSAGAPIVAQATPASVPASVPAPPAAAPGPPLADKERQLLAAVTDEPLDRKKLIGKAGLRYNSHSRAALKSLIDRGLVLLTADGVRARR